MIELNLEPEPMRTSPLAPSTDPAAIDISLLNTVPTPTLRCLIRRSRENQQRNGDDNLSAVNYFIIRLCAEMKLTLEQTFLFMVTKLPRDSYKFSGAPELLLADIARIRSIPMTNPARSAV